MEPKVSIVIAAYNVEKFIRKCVSSVVRQTYVNLEIIIVDDGSSDSTSKICDDFKKEDLRIKVIHQKNQGLSSARNNGIGIATGEYIALIDGDDYISKNFIEELIKAATNNCADIAVCGFASFPHGDVECPKNMTVLGKEATKFLLTQQNTYQVVSWNKIYKKDLFKSISFPINRLHEDSLTTYKLFAAAEKVTFINRPLYFYRQRQNSIMSTVKLENRLKSKLDAANEAKEYFLKNRELFYAAEVSEVLAYFAFLDESILGNLETPSTKEILNTISKNKKRFLKNPLLSLKLKSYIIMATDFAGMFYKVFRKIKHA